MADMKNNNTDAIRSAPLGLREDLNQDYAILPVSPESTISARRLNTN